MKKRYYFHGKMFAKYNHYHKKIIHDLANSWHRFYKCGKRPYAVDYVLPSYNRIPRKLDSQVWLAICNCEDIAWFRTPWTREKLIY